MYAYLISFYNLTPDQDLSDSHHVWTTKGDRTYESQPSIFAQTCSPTSPKMVPTLFLTVLCLAATVSTNAVILNTSPVSIPLTKRFDLTSLQGGSLLEHAQARVRALLANAGGTLVPVIGGNERVNNTGVGYVAAIGVGNPPTTCACHKDYTFVADSINIFR